jgi:hypothetical protein
MSTKKLRLEEIRVESFATGPDGDERGTVNAHEAVMGTGQIKCGTRVGPYCETQKLTGICGNCG